jgi:hypothetical protein
VDTLQATNLAQQVTQYFKHKKYNLELSEKTCIWTSDAIIGSVVIRAPIRHSPQRIRQTVALNPERQAYFVSPEDIILIKLDWYRLANGVLDRQWADVQSVIATQGNALDTTYMQHWATQLDIRDLLDAALRGAAPPRVIPPGDDSQQIRLEI